MKREFVGGLLAALLCALLGLRKTKIDVLSSVLDALEPQRAPGAEIEVAAAPAQPEGVERVALCRAGERALLGAQLSRPPAARTQASSQRPRREPAGATTSPNSKALRWEKLPKMATLLREETRGSEIFRYTENTANLLRASLSFFARLAIFGKSARPAEIQGLV